MDQSGDSYVVWFYYGKCHFNFAYGFHRNLHALISSRHLNVIYVNTCNTIQYITKADIFFVKPHHIIPIQYERTENI